MTEYQKTNPLQLFSDSDAELLLVRQELRDVRNPGESLLLDAASGEGVAAARAGDPSFQVGSNPR